MTNRKSVCVYNEERFAAWRIVLIGYVAFFVFFAYRFDPYSYGGYGDIIHYYELFSIENVDKAFSRGVESTKADFFIYYLFLSLKALGCSDPSVLGATLALFYYGMVAVSCWLWRYKMNGSGLFTLLFFFTAANTVTAYSGGRYAIATMFFVLAMQCRELNMPRRGIGLAIASVATHFSLFPLALLLVLSFFVSAKVTLFLGVGLAFMAPLLPQILKSVGIVASSVGLPEIGVKIDAYLYSSDIGQETYYNRSRIGVIMSLWSWCVMWVVFIWQKRAWKTLFQWDMRRFWFLYSGMVLASASILSMMSRYLSISKYIFVLSLVPLVYRTRNTIFLLVLAIFILLDIAFEISGKFWVEFLGLC